MAPQKKNLETIVADNDDEGRIILEMMEKDERLWRMEERKRLWETEFICKGIIGEMIEQARVYSVEKMVKRMILDMVEDASSKVEEVNELIMEIVTAAEEEG